MDASASPGSSTIQIVASGSGVSSASGTISLTIPTPTIAITAGSGTATVVQGGSTTVPITITRGGGFADVVSLTATGLPTGVTATFAPTAIASGSTTSTLTLTAAANASVGPASITITASGTGVTAQTATVALTVTAANTPAISLVAAPAAATVAIGSTATSTVTLTRSGGFTGDVALTVSGAPTGVTATTAPATVASAASTSTLTLNVGAGATPGLYNITVTGAATGVTSASTTIALTVTAAPAITIAAAPATLSIAAGSTATSVITLTRTNFTADVALAASNLPTGVTAAFSAPTLSGATLTSTLTLTAAANATIGTQSITVSATGTGVLPATALIATTVTAAQSYSLTATAVSAAQGATGNSTVTITRAGGYAGAVTLAVSGLPTGVTASIAPNATTGNSATITLTVGPSASVGTSTITISGTGAGLSGTVTTTFALTVTASGGGGGGSNAVAWTFCAADRFPAWFAYQSGTSGAWTRVTPTGTSTRVYSFSVNSVGAVAYAITAAGGGTAVTVQYGTADEFNNSGAQECTTNKPRQTLTGTVAGLGAGQSAAIYLNNASGTAAVNGPYTITNGPVGTSDLIGIRSALNFTTFSQTPDRVVLRRNVNYTSTIPAIDFATEGVAPATGTYTITNLAGESITQASTVFTTTNGSAGSFSSLSSTGAAALTVFGIPSASLVASDQHLVTITAIGTTGSIANTFRSVLLYNQQIANRSITLGAAPPALTPTSLGSSPYVRYSVSGSWAAEYGDAIGIGYTQTVANSNSWTLTMTRGYLGTSASTWTLAMPDLSGVAGFQTSWGMSAGPANWGFNQTGFTGVFNTTTGKFDEGALVKLASRTGSVSP